MTELCGGDIYIMDRRLKILAYIYFVKTLRTFRNLPLSSKDPFVKILILLMSFPMKKLRKSSLKFVSFLTSTQNVKMVS